MDGSAAECLQNGLVNQDMVICKALVVLQHVQCPFSDGFLQHIVMVFCRHCRLGMVMVHAA